MSPTFTAIDAAASVEPDPIEQLVKWLLGSPTAARLLIIGLPSVGVLASLTFGVSLFSALLAGCFLLAAALVCRKAAATFTGETLRLLAASRVVMILVLAALLYCTTGAAWTGLVSAVLLWLAADRLLGRRALHDLWKLSSSKP